MGKAILVSNLGGMGNKGDDSASILTIFMTREESKGGKGTQADMQFYLYCVHFYWIFLDVVCLDCGVEFELKMKGTGTTGEMR